jgi:hypothetical protein
MKGAQGSLGCLQLKQGGLADQGLELDVGVGRYGVHLQLETGHAVALRISSDGGNAFINRSALGQQNIRSQWRVQLEQARMLGDVFDHWIPHCVYMIFPKGQ